MVIVRALLPAFILTFVITGILAASGLHGGVLAIQQAPLIETHVYWSWPLFTSFTALGWALLAMMK